MEAVWQETSSCPTRWQGLRYRARLNGTYWRYVYNGERVLEETNDSGTVLARYTTESGSYYEPLHHMWRSSSTSRFPLYDAIGTARMLVDASGTVTDNYHLDAWGHQFSSTGSTVNPYKYGAAWGYITDPSGMLQLCHRFYWPEVGRFVQRDPAKHGTNRYLYSADNPVRSGDPTGRTTWSFVGQYPNNALNIPWFYFLYTAEADCNLFCHNAYGDAYSEWDFADCMDACDMVFTGGGGTHRGTVHTITIKCSKKKKCLDTPDGSKVLWEFKCESNSMP